VTTDLGKGHLNRPAAPEPAQDTEWVGVKVGAQERLRLEFAFDVADPHVADWHEASWMVPRRCAADNLDAALAAALPAGDLQTTPAGFRVDQALG